MNNDTTVLDHFRVRFPKQARSLSSEDQRDLSSIPLNSGCGDDCNAAIENAHGLYVKAVEAWGAHGYPGRVTPEQIAETAAQICITFICG